MRSWTLLPAIRRTPKQQQQPRSRQPPLSLLSRLSMLQTTIPFLLCRSTVIRTEYPLPSRGASNITVGRSCVLPELCEDPGLPTASSMAEFFRLDAATHKARRRELSNRQRRVGRSKTARQSVLLNELSSLVRLLVH